MTAQPASPPARNSWSAPVADDSPRDAHRPLSVVIGLEGLALGGCPINALDLGRTLIERGHQVHVFAIEEDVKVSILPYARNLDLPVTLLPARAGTARRAGQIQRFAARTGAEIVHVFAPWLGAAATIAASRLGRCSAVVTNWMMENVDYAPRRTALILGTRALQLEAQQRHRTRVWLMEPPVNLAADRPDPDRGRRFRAEAGIGEEEIAIVVVGRLDRHLKAEGLGYAIRAVAALDHPGLRLILVGDGDAYDHIARQASEVNRRLGRNTVVLTGAMRDPRPAYDGADIALGMGGSALRALAHAKPVVVLGEHGFARLFEPGSTGYFYTEGFYGTEAPADAVDHLLNELRPVLDRRRREELGRFGLEQVQARFGLEASAGQLEQIYRASLNASPNGLVRSARASYLLARSTGHEALRSVRQRVAT